MRGYLPSQSDDSKQPPRTSLLVRWLPSDHVLLDALRPFKARARGRRFKELATLGAELERRGFRLEAAGGGYCLMLPADMAGGLDLRVAPLPRREPPPQLSPDTTSGPKAFDGASLSTREAAVPAGAHIEKPSPVEGAGGPETPVIDDDTLEFAAGFG